MDAVILLCAGEQHRLCKLGYPKQLIRIAAEPILARTVRLVRELLGVPKICVAAAEGVFSGVCAELELCEHVVSGTPLLLSAERIMRAEGFKRAVVLLGDVCWSRALLTHWLDACQKAPTLACARLGPSLVTGKPYSEHFACNCTLEDLRRLDARRFQCLEDAARTNVFGAERLILQPPDDFTEDFDTPEDVVRLQPLLTELALREAA